MNMAEVSVLLTVGISTDREIELNTKLYEKYFYQCGSYAQSMEFQITRVEICIKYYETVILSGSEF